MQILKNQHLKDYFKSIIDTIDDKSCREGLAKTPERAAKALEFLTQGYHLNPEEALKSAIFKEDYSEMVVVKDIELYSLCEHHLLPFLVKHILRIYQKATLSDLVKYHA